ncbi:MAG: 6-bladed beta-propeller [Roseivirga sp.]|nr:6-bladed beta-propeller [Roseivirga sp.]
MPYVKSPSFAFLFAVFIFLFCSCSYKQTEQLTNSPDDSFQSYSIDLNAKEKKLKEAVEFIELMVFEDTDESLISEVKLSLKYKDMYILVTNEDQDIMFFDDRGNFIRKFNQLGEGPGEYNRILDIWVQEDIIGILDGSGFSIKKYNLEGEFIGSISLPSPVTHIHPINDQFLIQTNNNAYQDSLSYKWILTDKFLNPVNTYLPFDAPHAFEIAFPANYIRPYKSGLLFYSMFTDSLHTFTGHEFQPFAHIDFGDKWYWKDITNPSMKEVNGVQTSDKAWDLSLSVTGNFIFGRTPLGFQGFLNFMINRKTGLATKLNMTKPDGKLYTMDIEMVDDERFLFSLPSDEIGTLLKEFDQTQIKYRTGTTLQRIESQENPVFIWLKFKDSD